MKRRPWYQLTDKIQDAQFIWTQIKNSTIYQAQKKGDSLITQTIEKINDNDINLTKKTAGLKYFSLFNTT
jgi:ligand-binding sensor domain-containing protein